jgi:hypothetical protein
MKIDNKLLVVLGILITLLLTYYLYYLFKKNTVTEGFTNDKDIKDSFGNIIFNEDIKNIKDNTIVMLPGRFKITGLQVSGKTDKTVTSTYKVFIADNEEDIANPDTRTQLTSNKKGKNVFNMNTFYNDPLNFEKEGVGLFIGKVLLITTDDNNSDIRDIKPLPSTLDVMVLGLDPFAPSFQDYDKMLSVSPGDKDVKVGYIHIHFTKSVTSGEYRVKYSNTIDNNSNKFAVDGPNRLAFYANTNNPFIFFSKPVIVNKIHITNVKNNNQLSNTNYTLFGSETISKRDRANFKLQQQSFDEKHMIVDGEKCPNVGEMINKQLQAQQICEALEYKDKARNKKLAYEKDKVYLGKLAKQDQEIEELENIVKSLIERKNNRLDNNEGSNIDNLEKEMKRIEKIREDAEKHLKNNGKAPVDLRVKLNLDPEFKNVKKDASFQ